MENLDVNFGPQHNNRHQVLQKYSTSLKLLRNYAEKKYQLRPFVFDNYVLFQFFQQRSNDESHDSSGSNAATQEEGWAAFLKMELLNHILDRRRQIMYWLFYLLLALLCVLVYRYESSTSVAERSVKSMVYPGMRMWRRMTLPLIERFPRLTELYDESCLMGNPFFQMDDLSCSPCAHVEAVLDLGNTMQKQALESNNNLGIQKMPTLEYVPFIFKIDQKPMKLQQFYNIYSSNYEIFQRDAYRVQSTKREVTNLDELFIELNRTQQTQSHNLWRCNRMLPARLLRQLIARPSTLPNSLALERFMAIDTPQAPSYTLPDTECPHAYVQQALGNRFIILRPTSECRHRCRTLSMRLPQSFVLSYNWWYWKPISAPDPVSDTLSISLIGSYC
ncbi:uncharacterized protein LOC119637482 [Glossina fuscipes]|uniref:Uncharacterized protein LOC119637482 n=2 Tax=Nemorhina TaxID=44051 RepID=A0A9C5Z4M3_9MUSC|nr:uncharacterized protein LOC119637482 [Glossina fuscipes]KAI9582026.1 hypothetical protein GQX74_011521 [Glossina fuscipes]